MCKDKASDEAVVLQTLIDALSRVDQETRSRLWRTVHTFFALDVGAPGPVTRAAQNLAGSRDVVNREPIFSGHEVLSPKEFMSEKSPDTDVERVVCLAYYLAHYRDTTHFKTADISKLNTEAAQRKLTNATYTVNNATERAYFAHAPKNEKQLTAMGERYVEALPNREEARQVFLSPRPKKRRKKVSSKRKKK